MTRWVGLLVGLLYLASGVYVLDGDEQGVIRRFGRLDPVVRSSGVHWDWPAPFVRLDRVNVAAVQTLRIGPGPTPPGGGGTPVLLPTQVDEPFVIVTHDQNLLRLRAEVQYRWDLASVGAGLFGHRDLPRLLRGLVESALVDAASQVNVDVLQTTGIAELNQRLTDQVRAAAIEFHLGLDIERVTLETVEPPPQVLAEFLDVANARSEHAQVIQQARTAAEQQLAAAEARRHERLDQARGTARERTLTAEANAARFTQLVTALEADAESSGRPYVALRQAWERRLTRDLHRELLRAGLRAWVFDGDGVELRFPLTPSNAAMVEPTP